MSTGSTASTGSTGLKASPGDGRPPSQAWREQRATARSDRSRADPSRGRRRPGPPTQTFSFPQLYGRFGAKPGLILHFVVIGCQRLAAAKNATTDDDKVQDQAGFR